VYASTWWLDAVAPGRYEIIFIEKGGQIRAAWPLVYDQHTTSRIVMPPLTQKLGILFAPTTAKYAERLSEEHRLTEALLSRIPRTTSVYHHFHENFSNWLPLHWRGYEQSTRYTYILKDLRDTDKVWRDMRESTRRNIRRAEKNGLKIRPAADIAEFRSINKMSFDRQGMRLPYSLDQLARIDDACEKNARKLALVAEDGQGHPHACVYIVYDPHCAIYLLGGADPALRSSGAQALLKWEGIRRVSTVSKQFDFEGSMVKGIEAYVRGFGAIQTPYFQIVKNSDMPAGHEECGLGKSGVIRTARRLVARGLRKIARVLDR
jgi:hypothetical protein